MTRCIYVRTIVVLTLAAVLVGACAKRGPRTFATPEDAVRALTAAVKAGNLDEVIAIFGPAGQALIDSSDAATARLNREVFSTAVAEHWRLEDAPGGARVLVVGNENWPFPVPIVKDAGSWRFDTEAGVEEILSRRIGRNELAAIAACHTYVKAQNLYAARSHDGLPAGRFAARFASDPGRQNGLYWAAQRGERRSPLGDLVARAADEGRPVGGGDARVPFHGYYFRILPADNGFALVAWPAQYGATGIMTFIVNQDGTIYEKDFGTTSDRESRAMTQFKPDTSWSTVSESRSE